MNGHLLCIPFSRNYVTNSVGFGGGALPEGEVHGVMQVKEQVHACTKSNVYGDERGRLEKMGVFTGKGAERSAGLLLLRASLVH